MYRLYIGTIRLIVKQTPKISIMFDLKYIVKYKVGITGCILFVQQIFFFFLYNYIIILYGKLKMRNV